MATKSLTSEVAKNRNRLPILSLRQAVDRLFDDWGTDWDLEPFRLSREVGMFTPQVDVTETESEIEVSCELPGMNQKDIRLNLAEDCLTLSGEKKEEKEEKKKNYFRRERSFGSFLREIPLYTGIDRNKVRAVFKNGILKVTLPKSAEAKKRSQNIEIKTA